jgi:glycosyltransferase involved in cell wall biosynthesis
MSNSVAGEAYLLIAESFYPGELPGEARTNTYLAEQLSYRGWRVVVWAPPPAAAPPSAKNLTVIHRHRKWGYLELLRVMTWIVTYSPTKIGLLYNVTEFSLSPAVTWVPLLAKLLGLTCKTLMTNGVQPRRSRLQNKVFSALGFRDVVDLPIGPLAVSERVVVYSEPNKRALFGQSGWGSVCTIVSPPAVVLNATPDRVRPDSGFFRVGFFGLLYPSKGLEWIIEALPLIRKLGVSVRLSVIGENGGVTSNESWNAKCREYEENLHKLSKSLGVDDLIQWHGFQPDSEANKLISECDLVCLPFDEGLTGLRSSFVECAKLGIPIVTTLSDETEEYLRNRESGIIFVPPKSPESIAKETAHLVNDTDRRKELGQKIARFADSTFSGQSFVDAFEG